LYKKSVPVKDLYGNPHNIVVHFNLFETEVFKLIREFQIIFDWRERMQGEPEFRELEPGEAIDFYTALEEIFLSAYGVPSADGLSFDKSDRFKHESSVLHNACMLMFISDPVEANKMIDELMPKDMEELVKKADENLAALAKSKGTTADTQKEIEELRARLAAAEAGPTSPGGTVPSQ
jgi:hypothetical protein